MIRRAHGIAMTSVRGVAQASVGLVVTLRTAVIARGL